MYKSYKKEDFLKYLHLPDDFCIDGALLYGAMRKKKSAGFLDKMLADNNLNPKKEYLQTEGIYENALILNFDGKRILFDQSYGGAYMCEILHIACILGSKKNIFYGTCGGLIEEGKTG